MRPDGTILTCKRGKPKLANEAVPTRFPSLFAVFNKKGNPVKIPSYTTKNNSQARSDPAEPRAKMDAAQRAREDEKEAAILFCQDSIAEELAPGGNRIRDARV